jgi:cyanophycinase
MTLRLTFVTACLLACVPGLPAQTARPTKPSDLTNYFSGSTTRLPNQPVGGPALLPMGGSSEVDAAFTTYAYPIINGGDIVILRATGADGYQAYMYTDLVNQLPANLRAALQPNSVETLVINSRAKANTDYVEWVISGANLIWMAGGDQSDYTGYWRGTKVETALRAAYARGAVIGGTSAGAAVLGEFIYDPGSLSAVNSASAMADSYAAAMILTDSLFDAPLGFDLYFEPHFANRTRMGRTLSMMARIRQDARTSAIASVALDEATSMFIDKNGLGTVQRYSGSGSVYILRETRLGTRRVQVASGQPVIYRNIERLKLAPGNTYNFKTGEALVPGTTPTSITPLLLSVETTGVVPASHY